MRHDRPVVRVLRDIRSPVAPLPLVQVLAARPARTAGGRVTVTATATPQETVRYAGAVLRTMMPAIAAALELDGSLDRFCLIATGEISWECFFPELSDEADPHEAALEKAAREAEARAEDLIGAMARCGVRVPETAGGAR